MRATLEELKYKRLDLLAMKTKTLKIEKIQEILKALQTKKEGVFF
jgi:threonine dehydrogenase-like Zn-dependent dehydrogenase